MAKENIAVLELDVTGLVLGVKAAKTVLAGLDKTLGSLAESMKEAFSVRGYNDYKDTVRRFGKEVADSLLVMQLAFGKLKSAIATAAAPIVGTFVPMLNQAIFAAIRFANIVGQVIAVLFGARSGTDALAESQDDLASATSSAGRAARRSVMGFDELNRLNAASGGGGSVSAGADSALSEQVLSPRVMAIVEKIRALIEPLKQIDFTPLMLALQQLWAAVQPILQMLGQALQWLWFNVLTPLIAWVIEELAPAFTLTLASALEAVTALLEPMQAGWGDLWEGMKPVIAFMGETVIQVLQALQTEFSDLTATLNEKSTKITGIMKNVGSVIGGLWTMAKPTLENLRTKFLSVFADVGAAVSDGAATMIDRLFEVTTFLSTVFSGGWASVWEWVQSLLKSAVNKVVGLLNKLISLLVSALNSVIGVANRLKFTVPSWVPTYGGRTFGVSMSKVSATAIPYLAQGAVLPANKPFLAMVGDQRHGTNIEAPLATIQEAVAQVMADMENANAAGQEAIVQMLQRILQAVLGIQIGDTVIGQAAQRYQNRMAIISGI